MRIEPPTAIKRTDGWWIVIKQLGATYTYGPIDVEEMPCKIDVYDLNACSTYRFKEQKSKFSLGLFAGFVMGCTLITLGFMIIMNIEKIRPYLSLEYFK